MTTECKWPEKRRHETKADAKKAIRSRMAYSRGSIDMVAYPCGDHWHIGHNGARFAKRVRYALRAGRG